MLLRLTLLCFALGACADERIAGTSALAEATDLRAALPALLRAPLDSAEVALWLEHAPEAAARLRQERSLRVTPGESPDARLARLRALPVWADLELSCDELLAGLVKLSFGLELASTGLDGLRAEQGDRRAELEALLPRIGDDRPELRAELEASLALLDALDAALDAVPDTRVALIDARRDALQDTVGRLWEVIE